jgi:hypothetical protein
MEYKGNSGQEKFVLDLLKNKKNGYYVELGAFDSKKGSNTYHLETDYDWNGVSFEIDPERHAEFVSNRKNPCILGDATEFNYISYFEENNFPKQIDYLQVDIDAGYTPEGNAVGNPYLTLHGLISVPLSKYRFSIITFEHDSQIEYNNKGMREAQREILSSLGYKLVVREWHEDWWVDPYAVPYLDFREKFKMAWT